MNRQFDAQNIRQMLDRSSARLDQPTLEKLRHAREQALARYDAHSTAPAFAWAGFGHGSGRAADSHRRHYLYLAAAVLLALSLFSAAYWQQKATEHDHDVSDVDIAILTDDLPIDVYVN